jgi:IclR family acetate operon transcriptional repressor
VQALDRGLQILNALAKEGAETLTELSLTLGLPASTLHRLLTTLQGHGFVEFQEEDQRWTIGVEAFRVGGTFLQRTKVVEVGRMVMRRLHEETQETVNIAIPDQGDVVFVGQMETHQPLRAFFRLGTRGYMHASGIGKALLAEMPREEVEKLLARKGLPALTPRSITQPEKLFSELERVHKRGWALDDEERMEGMRCVSSAIYNEFGEAVAGISVSGPSVRLGDNAVAEIAPKVRAAAAQITELIGGRMASD